MTPADFDRFFERTYPSMLARAIMLCGHRQDAEDAVQEAYTEAFRCWDRIGGYDSPEAWVHKVITQRLWAASRRRIRQRYVELEVLMPAHSTPGETAEARTVLSALAGLPPAQRTAIILHCLYGLSQKEIAQQLRVARGTVAASIYTARRTLEKVLGMTPPRRSAPDPLMPTPGQRPPRPAPQNADPLSAALLATERWLREQIETDRQAMERIREGIASRAASEEEGR